MPYIIIDRRSDNESPYNYGEEIHITPEQLAQIDVILETPQQWAEKAWREFVVFDTSGPNVSPYTIPAVWRVQRIQFIKAIRERFSLGLAETLSVVNAIHDFGDLHAVVDSYTRFCQLLHNSGFVPHPHQ